MTVLTNLRAALEKHRAYTRTRNEIAAMPRDVALDLGLFPEDAARIAHEAVYGCGAQRCSQPRDRAPC